MIDAERSTKDPDERAGIIRPRINNLRWFPESQTEPDDETSFDFDIVNDSTEFAVVIRVVHFQLVPTAGGATPFPGYVRQLESRAPHDVSPVTFFCQQLSKGKEVRIDRLSSTKLYGVLLTSSASTAKYPYAFSMKVSLTWAVFGDFVEDVPKAIANVIKED